MNAARQFLGVAPTFFVADVVKAADYYAEKLGFRSPILWGDPPVFAIPAREDMRVMLSQQDKGRIHPNGALDGSMDAYFWVRNADELHDEYQAAGADIVFAPRDETAYGMREFAVRDVDGYVLIFAHDISARN